MAADSASTLVLLGCEKIGVPSVAERLEDPHPPFLTDDVQLIVVKLRALEGAVADDHQVEPRRGVLLGLEVEERFDSALLHGVTGLSVSIGADDVSDEDGDASFLDDALGG